MASCSSGGMKLRRHLGALIQKNWILKRRRPCSLACELLLAIAATGLLAFARFLTKDLKAFETAAELHVDSAMPVRLPECAEYVSECSVRLVDSEPHSPLCVKGVTYGCHSGKRHQDGRRPQAGVWVTMGCNATFESGDGSERLTCASRKMGRMRRCHFGVHRGGGFDGTCDDVSSAEKKDCGYFGIGEDGCREKGCCWQPAAPTERVPWCFFLPTANRSRMLKRSAESHDNGRRLFQAPSASLGSLVGMALGGQSTDLRRLDAVFGIVPADAGGRAFLSWLRRNRHPWAANARLFSSSAALQAHILDRGYPARDVATNKSTALCGAVVFDTSPMSSDVRYTLRFNASLVADANVPMLQALMSATRLNTRTFIDIFQSGRLNLAGMTWYTQSGFLSLQRSVDTFVQDLAQHGVPRATRPKNGTAMLSSLFGEDDRLHLVVPFPTPSQNRDLFGLIMPNVLGLFLLMSLTYSVNRMITVVVHEREARLRDGMRMMGMHPTAFYSSWILTYLAIYVFVSAGVVALLILGSIVARTNAVILFIWLMLFAAASISYALLISTFFTKAKTAATVGSVMFFSSSYFVHLANPTSPPSFLRVLSLLPPVCFQLSAKHLAKLESQGIGITWQTMSLPGEGFLSFSESCSLLLLDAIVLLVIFLYMDQVAPRDFGIQQPWYFPLLPSFWCSSCGRGSGALPARTVAIAPDLEASQEAASLVERDLGEAAATLSRSGQVVELVGLRKEFGSFVAVKSLDLTMLQGEIFALLGHNGAGKTTTLAMLCGLLPPTRGSCTIFGHCLDREPVEVQKLLGVCPQHDVLWDDLTCSEHLTLFAQFKGVPPADVAAEVEGMLNRVGLQKVGAGARQAGKLSGGMKRKLSLGIAFLGGSRFVVLDEPTSGLDPYSRRTVWELLRAMKHGRVTVLSTHYMDEADILGDRIAILHEGSLRCCGSPQFLKRAYDCGYNLTFVKQPSCDPSAVFDAVTKHLPELASEVVMLSNSGSELIVQVPFAAASHFPQVLGSLEQNLGTLGIESYGVSVTTLEEVFLKVASGEAVDHHEATETTVERPSGQDEYIELGETSAAPRGGEAAARARPDAAFKSHRGDDLGAGLGCRRRCAAHMKALLLKRVRYGARDRRGFLCQLCLPSATLIFLLSLISSKLFTSMPPLDLDVANYNANAPGKPQNMVDFSHVPSVDFEEAEALLMPGKALWKGELRHFQPRPADPKSLGEEELLFSTLPGAMHIFRLAVNKVVASGNLTNLTSALSASPRRLGSAADGGDVVKGLALRRLSQLLKESWAAVHSKKSLDSKASLVKAVEQHVGFAHPEGGRRLEGLFDRLQQAAHRHGFGSPSQAPQAPTPTNSAAGSPRVSEPDSSPCDRATQSEMTLWGLLDKDRDSSLTRSDLLKVLHTMLPAPGGVAGHMDQVDEIVVDAIFVVFDKNHDHEIQEEEFCEGMEPMRRSILRLRQLSVDFSWQLLNHSSSCTRYGAYYVTRGPRDEATEAWEPGSDAVIFVNTTSQHAAPSFQAALTNARFSRLGLGKKVAVAVHPFPQTPFEQQELEQVAVFLLAVYITFCMSFIPSSIVYFVVKEKSTGSQQLQILSGMSRLTYWTSNLCYDLLLYIVPAVCVPLALRQFGFDMIVAGECGWALAAILAAFGPAVASFSYLVAFFYKDHSKAANAVLSFCLVGASVLSTVLFILSIINFNPTYKYPNACERPTEEFPHGACNVPAARTADKILGPIFRLVPTVCLYQALFAVALVANIEVMMPKGSAEALKSMMGEDGPSISTSPFAYEWAGEPLLYLLVQGALFFLLTVAVDVCLNSPRLARWLDAPTHWSRCWRRLRLWRARDVERSSPLMAGGAGGAGGTGDPSVELESERTELIVPADVALHVSRLEKVYRRWFSIRTPPKRAVKGISFSVHAGEVFGLLGHNGAGKTSTIRCLVGEESCTAGDIHVGGLHMEREVGKARWKIGYCPQFDALLELLTVQDHLSLFASLKGMSLDAAEAAVQTFGLASMTHRRADVLSGGNKRKLSAALALMGSPSLAVLDEPSCGLDPAARRALWRAVQKAVEACGVRSQASAVLLTTHSMEEAEALSTRLGIMGDGHLLTVGTSQQIKQRYGSCHELHFSLRPESEDTLAQTLLQLGAGRPITPDTALRWESLAPLLEADAGKKRAYARARCVVRAQIEAIGHVEAAVLAEWWIQQSRGEAIERFLRGLVGDNVELAENFGMFWRFRLPLGGCGLPELFRHLEESGKALGIAEYTLSQATLEQIFNGIAGEAQRSAEAEAEA